MRCSASAFPDCALHVGGRGENLILWGYALEIMELEAGCLPEALQKKDLGGKIGEICRRNDIVFMAIFGSFVRRGRKKQAMST